MLPPLQLLSLSTLQLPICHTYSDYGTSAASFIRVSVMKFGPCAHMQLQEFKCRSGQKRINLTNRNYHSYYSF